VHKEFLVARRDVAYKKGLTGFRLGEVFHYYFRFIGMRKLIIVGLCLVLSCSDPKNKDSYFIGYTGELSYTGKINNLKEESLFEFYNKAGDRVCAGNYLNGFRNNEWFYNVDDSLIEIKWAPYSDKKLGFETNIFAIVDSVTRGDFFTDFVYVIDKGKLNLTITKNSPFVDTLALVGYRNNLEAEFESKNFTISSFDSSFFQKIKIYSFTAINVTEQKTAYYNAAIGYIGNDCFQITVGNNKGVKKQYNDILFEGVLTNFYYNNKRLYYPFATR
jgi:hypothetical protein